MYHKSPPALGDFRMQWLFSIKMEKIGIFQKIAEIA